LKKICRQIKCQQAEGESWMGTDLEFSAPYSTMWTTSSVSDSGTPPINSLIIDAIYKPPHQLLSMDSGRSTHPLPRRRSEMSPTPHHQVLIPNPLHPLRKHRARIECRTLQRNPHRDWTLLQRHEIANGWFRRERRSAPPSQRDEMRNSVVS
jgi:hypothetical protein